MADTIWDSLREAIKQGRTDEALELLEQAFNLTAMQLNSAVSFVGMAVTQLAGFGEEELEKLYRKRYLPMAKEWIATTPGARESAEKCTQIMASPYSEVILTEEPDRYVVSLNPCRTGGRLLRGVTAGMSQLDSKVIGTTQEAHPWCWGKSGILYYCAHSCLLFEVLPIELRGYPIGVIEPPEKPEDPCVFYFYKKPELIPEKYFTRLGKTKTIK